VADQAGTSKDVVCRSGEGQQFAEGEGWGWAKFMSLADLRNHPGYLVGDRLVLRATVEVLQ